MVMIVLYHKPGGAKDDIPTYFGITLGVFIPTLIFSFVEQNNVLANVTKNIREFEYEQYKEMFNSLQEGIIVINSPNDKTADKQKYSVFFANEMMQLLMQELLGIRTEMKKDMNFAHLSSNMDK